MHQTERMERQSRYEEEITEDDLPDDTLFAGGNRHVAQFITDNVTRLAPSTSLREAAVALRRDDVSLAAVGVGSAIEGVISERDLVRAIAAGLDLDDTTVATIESGTLKWAPATSTVDVVAEEMLETYVRHILVGNEDGTLAGVVSMRDLLTAYLV